MNLFYQYIYFLSFIYFHNSIKCQMIIKSEMYVNLSQRTAIGYLFLLLINFSCHLIHTILAIK